MKISKERLNAQIAAVSLRTISLEEGNVVTVQGYTENDVESGKQTIASDSLVCAVKGHDEVSQMRIPLREFLKMRDTENNPLYQSEDDADESEIANKFTVTKVTNRTRNGENVYPIGAYRDAQKLYDGDMNYNECIKGGFGDKTEEGGVTFYNGFPPLKDYIVDPA